MAGILDFLGLGQQPQQQGGPQGILQAAQQEPDFLGRLAIASQNMSASQKILPSLIGGIAGLTTGRSTDPRVVQQQQMGNQTAQALISKGVDPEIANASKNNPVLMKALIDQHFGTKQVQNLGNGFIYKDGQVVKAYDANEAGGTEYGLNPIYGKDAQGNEGMGVLGKNGTFKIIDTGGLKLQAGVDKIDLGTHYQLRDKKTGAIVGVEQKDLAGAAKAKEVGEGQGKAQVAAPGDIQNAENALSLVEQIRSHPYLDRGTGSTSYFNTIRGTGGYDFQNMVDQAKSGAFLTAIQQMRGLGALSNAEGSAATAAVNRMNTASSKEEFLAATKEYEKYVRQGMERASKNLPAGSGAAAPAASAPVDYRTYFGSK